MYRVLLVLIAIALACTTAFGQEDASANWPEYTDPTFGYRLKTPEACMAGLVSTEVDGVFWKGNSCQVSVETEAALYVYAGFAFDLQKGGAPYSVAPDDQLRYLRHVAETYAHDYEVTVLSETGSGSDSDFQNTDFTGACPTYEGYANRFVHVRGFISRSGTQVFLFLAVTDQQDPMADANRLFFNSVSLP